MDWLTVLPWGLETVDTLDVQKAMDILDEDHYGMKDVKDRVEYFAVFAITSKMFRILTEHIEKICS